MRTEADQIERPISCNRPHLQPADINPARLAKLEKGAATTRPVLLTVTQAAQVLGISERSFNYMRKQPWFPQPVQLGPRILRFVASEIEAAAVAHAPRTPIAEPHQLLRARVERIKATGIVDPATGVE